VLVKAILQLPLIIFLGALGPVISTAIGLGVPIALMYNHLHTVTHFTVEITGPRAPRKIINGNCRIALTKTPIAK